jgi:alpha,alpha-trehalose phosphorylase
VLEAMTHARQRGWRGLIDDQLGFLDQFWADADVEVEPDADLQLAIRFNLFQVLQASACLSEAPIGAKGLTGSGYSGHTFWDIEGFVAPTLTLLRPGAAARLLNWRASTLGAARQRAEVLGMKGASFAWRTVDGREVSAYWPASTAAVHLNAGISRAFALHANATGTPLTEIGGVGVLVETARMWASIAHRDDNKQFHFLGVTGPDEYTGVVDDNVLTNLVAQRNLWGAAEACRAYPDETGTLSVTQSEADEWRRIGDSIYVPFDAARQVHPSNEGFTLYREWKFDKDPNAYPIQKHAHYAKVYRRQVVKQADLVLALWWCPEAFTEDQKARAFNYYEQRTVRDSSLSAPVQSVVAARVGHLDLALEYLREAAYTDLCDVQQDTHQGLHLAPLAGSWLALASGFGGLKMDEDQLHLAPRLPEGLRRIAFRVRWRGQCVLVETTHAGTVIRLRDEHGPDQHVTVDGRPMLLTTGRPLRAPLVSSPPATPPPQQPPTREPGLRSREPG